MGIDFNGAVIDMRRVNSNGAFSSGDFALLGDFDNTGRNYTAGLTVVENSVYVGLRTDSIAPSSRIVRLVLDRTNHTLTDSGQSWNSGTSGEDGNGFPYGTVDLIDYQHPTLGDMLFAAHSNGVISRFAVTANGSLNQYAQTVQTASHPYRMLVRRTAVGDYLIATTSNGVAVYSISETDGTLTELQGSPFVDFGTTFGVAR